MDREPFTDYKNLLTFMYKKKQQQQGDSNNFLPVGICATPYS